MTTYLKDYRNGKHLHEMRTPKYIFYTSVVQDCCNSSAELDAEILFFEWFFECWESRRRWETVRDSWSINFLLLNDLWAEVSEGKRAAENTCGCPVEVEAVTKNLRNTWNLPGHLHAFLKLLFDTDEMNCLRAVVVRILEIVGRAWSWWSESRWYALRVKGEIFANSCLID